jgi:hypothetical protein
LIAIVGSVALPPFAACARQALPVIGFLDSDSPEL